MAHLAGIALACLVLGFVIGWGYFRPAQERGGAEVAFATVGPLVIASQGYAFRAELAVQTGADDASWLKKNTPALSDAVHRALADADPRLMRTPAGLARVQEGLAPALNASLDRPRVRRVLFTGFLIQASE